MEKFEHESFQDTETIGKYFESLIESFKKGTLRLTTEEDELLMKLNTFIKVRIRAKKKDDNNRLDISLSWKDKIDDKRKQKEIIIGS